jgi:hypothetical protein
MKLKWGVFLIRGEVFEKGTHKSYYKNLMKSPNEDPG